MNRQGDYNYGLALLKILMCFEVVCCHFWYDNYPLYLLPFALLLNCAVPVFMMVSFILNQETLEKTTAATFKHRFWRLAWPHIAWAFIYWAIYNFIDTCFRTDLGEGIRSLVWQLLTGHSLSVNQTMWYQVIAIVLTLIFSIIFCFVKKPWNIVVVYALFVLALVLQFSGLNVQLFRNSRIEIRNSYGRIVEVLPFAVIGFTVAHYKVYEKLKSKRCQLLTAFGLLILLFAFLQVKGRFPETEGFRYSGIYLLGMSTFLTLFAFFTSFEKVNGRIKKVIKYVAKYTLGVYCIHRLIAKPVFIVFAMFGWSTSSFIICIIIFIISLLVSVLIGCLPWKIVKQLVQ